MDGVDGRDGKDGKDGTPGPVGPQGTKGDTGNQLFYQQSLHFYTGSNIIDLSCDKKRHTRKRRT